MGAAGASAPQRPSFRRAFAWAWGGDPAVRLQAVHRRGGQRRALRKVVHSLWRGVLVELVVVLIVSCLPPLSLAAPTLYLDAGGPS